MGMKSQYLLQTVALIDAVPAISSVDALLQLGHRLDQKIASPTGQQR
jgi:hypothetical protein